MLGLLILSIPCSFGCQVANTDAHRFDWITPQLISERKDFAANHLAYVSKLGPTAYEWACEAQQHYEAWDALSDVRMSDGRQQVEYLVRLRDLIGFERYYSGLMPEAVPLRWFTEGR